MSGAWPSMLDEELADTLAAARARRGLPPVPARQRDLTRNLVAERPPALGVCRFCGGVAPGTTVCHGHEDLPPLDPATAAVVTENTNGSGRTSPEEMSAARARQERF